MLRREFILTNIKIAPIIRIVRREPEQLEIDRRRWGGRRPGAGRKPGPNPRLRHRSREAFGRGLPCHVTLKVRKDVPSLRSVRLVREVEATFARGCERGEFRLVHYSLQGDHAHLIVEAADRHALGRGMKALGCTTGPSREPDLRALRAGACRSLPRARAQTAARGAECAGLRAAERSPACGQGRSRAVARDRDRSGVVGKMVRRLEEEAESCLSARAFTAPCELAVSPAALVAALATAGGAEGSWIRTRFPRNVISGSRPRPLPGAGACPRSLSSLQSLFRSAGTASWALAGAAHPAIGGNAAPRKAGSAFRSSPPYKERSRNAASSAAPLMIASARAGSGNAWKRRWV